MALPKSNLPPVTFVEGKPLLCIENQTKKEPESQPFPLIAIWVSQGKQDCAKIWKQQEYLLIVITKKTNITILCSLI